MIRILIILFLFFTFPALADTTDLNIVTGIDVSDSITVAEEELEYNGLIKGLLNPEFLQRIEEGPNRQIGFIVFTWAGKDQFNIIVPWTIIRTKQDVISIAEQLKNAPRMDRVKYGVNRFYNPDLINRNSSQGMTDISQAITNAIGLITTSPFIADRSVLNMLSDGYDNNGAEPTAARDLALSLNITINGILFGDHVEDLPHYYIDNIITGPGAFLIVAETDDDLIQALKRKFWQDMISFNSN